MVRPTLNELFRNDTCLCGIDVRRGAKVFAIVLLVLAVIRAMMNITFSLMSDEPAYYSWLIYHVMMIVCCVMVLTAERKDEAWFYLPAVATTGVFGLSKIFIGIVGLISVAFDVDQGKEPVFGYIPKHYLRESAFLEDGELLHNPHLPPENVNITCLILSCVLIVLGVLNCYVSWVTLRAYHQMKHSAEYIIPRTACNTNYKSPKGIQVTAYSPSDTKKPPKDQGSPLDIVPVGPRDVTPVASHTNTTPADPRQDATNLA